MPDLPTTMAGSWMDYLKVLLILGGILMMAIVTLRFWLPRMRGWNTAGGGPIAVLGQFTLEPRKTLYVVRAGKAVLLMGSSDAGLQFMTMLDGTEFDDAVIATTSNASTLNFARLLQSVRSRNHS